MGSAEVQGTLWGAAPEDWAEINEPFGVPLYEAVFDDIAVGNGTRLLDVGCGAGLALQLAQKRGATVSGLDASAGLLGVARRRLPEADLREGELQELPYSADSFDSVTSFNAVQYATDPIAALREIRRVTVPGGNVVVVTWAEPERNETRVMIAAMGALLPPPPPGAGGPFALSAPGKLEEFVSTAGLTPQRAAEVPSVFEFADLDTAVRGGLSSGPAQIAIRHAGREAVADAIRTAMTEFRQPDGSYRQNNAFRYVVATA